MPKSCGSGQALTLTTEQLDSIMREASPKLRAVFQICRCTACRVSESLSLLWANVTATDIIFPKSVTKGKLKTRTIPMNWRLTDELRAWRAAWTTAQGREPEKADFLFPSATGTAAHFTRKNVDRGLRPICARHRGGEHAFISAQQHHIRIECWSSRTSYSAFEWSFVA